jgi:hypothetical protein
MMGYHYDLLLTIILFVMIGTFLGGLLWRLYQGDHRH